MRRRHVATHENHERWLVSYADFITLLFAFFVVMFASTQADKNKARQVSEAVREALEHGQFSNAISTVLGRGKHEAARSPLKAEPVDRSENLSLSPATAVPAAGTPQPRPADLAKSLQALQHGLAAELVAGKIDLKLLRRGLVISLRESAFFASGDDAIAPASLPTVSKIAAEIQKLSNPMRLEGHTDSVPIHNSRFRSNWELSAARAIAMVEVLRQQFQIPPQRMSVSGYAENAPADTNDTPEGRSHNRRVDLVVLSAEAELNEPNRQKPENTSQEPAGKEPGQRP
jgi:chemotaxis protein MotB